MMWLSAGSMKPKKLLQVIILWSSTMHWESFITLKRMIALLFLRC
uniref:COPI coat complex subunit gamma 2 n=1 Tax=Molossus molossus TaxID=27622 RepID=A0A7J8HA93_MOLMO|nr:COPI coat complex subunit gamma 2 [Molossus molossus]